MRAVALLSGGLDSQLAVRVVQRQGIEVVGVHFFHRFNRPGDPGSWPDERATPAAATEVTQVGVQLGIETVLSDFSRDFLAFVNKPR
ncbi:MAG: tRNA (5-methylaminomethyl-2-thiouridylate)-methyltransferase, partial [Candidatus Eisenbacteria bacterium]|nr:tRNA (5-methylaminomethyl-2-thiouridylate)-methyltransferase [Candidatus Eisenbacteria bacterium]